MSFSPCLNSPFRADIVGSFLRPAKLKNARNLHHQNLINDAQLKAVEDECIKELVENQVKHGLQVITDGEFRRSWWHLDFMWGLNGVSRTKLERGYQFVGIETRAEAAALTGPVDGHNHPFVEHFKFLKQFESLKDGLVARQTLPAPAQTLVALLNVFSHDQNNNWQHFYQDEDEFIIALGQAYRQVFKDLYDAGCRSIQIDDCTWPLLCDKDLVANRKIDVERISDLYLRANNECLKDKPKDLVIATHMCRGNFRSHYFSKGSYDRVANVVFAHENVDAFYLEYDDERSGNFEALKSIPQNKKVVLGLVTSKHPELEDIDGLVKRVEEASQYFPLDNLCVSTQCGFASTEEGNELSEQQQWDKIDLVVKLAHKIWG